MAHKQTNRNQFSSNLQLESLEDRTVPALFDGVTHSPFKMVPAPAQVFTQSVPVISPALSSALVSGGTVGAQSVLQPLGTLAEIPWVARHGLTAAQYQTEFTSRVNQGYRLIDVSGYEVNGQARYAAIWDKSTGPAWAARHGLTPAQYQSEFNNLVNQGYRPVHVSGYTVSGKEFYAAIFQKSSGVAWVAKNGLTSAQYQTEFTTRANQGYRLIDISGYEVGGEARYAAIWEKSSGVAWNARHGMTAAQYQAEFNKQTSQGYRLVRVSGYSVGGKDTYAAIFEKSSGTTWLARHGQNAAQYQGEFTNLVNQGYRLSHVSAYTVAGVDEYASIWENLNYSGTVLSAIENDVNQFMQKYGVPGASIAISKDDRLVYAHGFGQADKTTGDSVTVNSLFRIASETKAITSAAIFTLVDQGRLKLTDKVFGKTGVLGTQYGTKAYGPNIEKITVQNLLEHTGGGWANDSRDPMFTNPSMNQNQLITWVLDNRPLDNVPGTTYAYSNFGYCVLGRIIEKVTGKSYSAYVQSAVLTPSGISDMVIAGNTLADRKTNEVRYYGQNSENPYGMQVSRMDSHGGWLASATDMLRFISKVDGFPGKPDILSSNSIKVMSTPSTANSGYAKGWQVNSVPNWWHTGSLPGAASIMMRSQSGIGFVALLNTRSIDSTFFSNLDNLMWKVIGEIKTWPTTDLWA